VTLRPYQLDADARTREALKRLRAVGKRPAVLVVMPTGGGKTVLFAEGIIARAVKKSSSAWVVVPKNQLVKQTSRKLDSIGIPHGIIQADSWRTNYAAPVQVCSIWTLVRRLDNLAHNRPHVVVWDEAHHIAEGNSYAKVLDWLGPSVVSVGYTATPCRLDGKGLGSAFEEMIVATDIADLTAQGFLVPARVFVAAKGPDLDGVRKCGGDFNQKQLGERMGTSRILGDIVVEWSKHGEGRRTVCFAVNVDHSQQIVAAFKTAGIPAAHIDADTPDADRDRLIAALDAAEIKVLSSVGVFTEGFDLPSVGAVIMARPTASLSLYLQMAGRGVRPAKGIATAGEDCIFLDHAGNTVRHGFITDPRDWSLADGAKKPKQEREQREVLVEREGVQRELAIADDTPLVEITAAGFTTDDPGFLRSKHGKVVPVTPEQWEAVKAEETDLRAFYCAAVDAAFIAGEEAWVPSYECKRQFGRKPTTKQEHEWSNGRIKFGFDYRTKKHERQWQPPTQGASK